MTHPAVDDLPEQAAATLLGVCGQLSQSRYKGLGRWAASVSDALLARLVSVTTGVCVVFDAEHCPPLAQLDGAELEDLQSVVAAGADASDDDAVISWCTRMGSLIGAEFYRRHKQAVIDAKAAAIATEEQRIAREAGRVPGLYRILP
ncbi:MAG: hypothetical protein JO082_02075 [Mycobacterium sp.]|nr:hypothetical protein [Mycobacterium sp.]